MAKTIWAKTGLDKYTILLMMKWVRLAGLIRKLIHYVGALLHQPSPWQCKGSSRYSWTELIAGRYQANSVASEFTTFGYLVAIVSIMGFPIMPRAKFIQLIIMDVLSVCSAAAFALLMMYCAVKARQNTEPSFTGAYNSSASAVSGVWLFFQIYLVHSFRAKYPQFQFPVVIYSIFANITTTYAPSIGTMDAAMGLVKKMLTGFLTGLAITTGTSLFIYPVTTRTVVFKEMAAYIGGLRAALHAHSEYYESLRHEDMFGRTATYDETVEKHGEKGKVYSPEAEAIRVAIQNITDLHGKLHGDLTFAKREVAIGKLGPDDLRAMFKRLRKVMVPVMGLSFIVDIFQRLSDYNRWNEPLDSSELVSDAVRRRVVQEWNDIMGAVYDPFSSTIESIDEGLQHISYVFRLAKPPKRQSKATGSSNGPVDVEESAESSRPGEKGFAAHFERKLREFNAAKRLALRAWSEAKGIRLPPDFFEQPSSLNADIEDIPLDSGGMSRDRSRRQLYMFLYVRPTQDYPILNRY